MSGDERTSVAEGKIWTVANGRSLLLCLTYITVSCILIRFNKYLMTEGRFPFSMALTAMHMTVSLILALTTYWFAPGLFPGMANASGKRVLLLKWFVPIGLAFAISLYASNAAYRYLSVSFLQFMKEGNVVITFLMSCAIGLQSPTRVQSVVILWVVAGSTCAVTGEMHFVFVGFMLQLIAQLAECTRAVAGETVLRGAGLKLDPLSYTMFIAPTCLAVLIVGNVFAWNPEIPQQAALWWHYLLPNACLAFLLNVLVAAVIKEVSAVGFVLAGLVKDIVLVLFSVAFFGEAATAEQYISFAATLSGVAFWSYLKAVPDSGTHRAMEAFLGGVLPGKQDEKEVQGETTALLRRGP